MKHVSALALTAFLFSGAAQAVPVSLVEYNTANTATLAASYSDPSVTPVNVTAGSGISLNAGSTFNFTGWDPSNASAQDAIDDDEVWRFGFTALQDITLTSLDIRLDRSGSGPDDVEIFGAIDMGPRTSLFTHDFADSASGVNFTNIDLSAFSLSAGQSMGFLVTAFNSELLGGAFDLETIFSSPRNFSIRVSGEVAPVPVPAAVWLFGSALLGLIGMRRKS